MSMRITGLATGMDIDQVIKDTMKPHRIKIQQVQQNKEVTEIRQRLYREVIKESREFYNKYLDIAKSDSILRFSNWSAVKFTSSDSTAVTAKGLGGASSEAYTIKVDTLASSAKATLSESIYENENNNVIKVTIDGATTAIDISSIDRNDNSAIVNAINTALKGKGGTAKYSEISKGIVFERTVKGVDETFEVSYGVDDISQQSLTVTPGTELSGEIKNSMGSVYLLSGSSNKIVVDNTEFTFNKVTSGDVTLTPTIDATSAKDKIVSFINDYNKFMERLNTLTSEKRDRNFMPLTEEQKKELSESEVKLWQEKVERGQLRRDSDLMRISNKLKDTTRTAFSGNIASLEKIGINPVADYTGSKNGTFTIDEEKLTAALENNIEDVMKLFIGSPSTPGNVSETGIAQRIKTVLYDETITIQASLIKKAGLEGTSTVANNQLTKSIEQFDKRMKDMETIFSRREQQLYTQYAKVESMMNKLNSQQSYLMSQLGMG